MSIGLISLIGMIIGIVLLIWLSFKGLPLLVLGPIASGVVLLFAAQPVVEGLTTGYAQAFAGFAEANFLLFLPACILGAMLGECGAAKDISIAVARVARKAGTNAKYATIMGLAMITAVLSYGGVSGFVVIFTMTPICKVLFKELDIPWHFIIAMIVYGGSMWTAILPGSPAIQNLIPIDYLGTTPTSGPWIGVIAAVLCIIVGAVYIKVALAMSEKKGEGFLPTGAEINKTIIEESHGVAYLDQETGSVLKALTPSLVLLITMNILKFAPEAALTFGCVTCAILYWKKFPDIWGTMSAGGKTAALSIINVCAVVGFGGVIKAVPGFEFLVSGLDAIPGPPLIQLALATNLIAGISASASGGEGIALEAFGQRFLDMGVNPDVIHRIVNISCYGLDSLPNNGSVINRLNYTKLTHKQGYYHEFWLGAVWPFILSFIAVGLAQMGIV
ncbi:GntP family permease [Trichococcus alkaliphilus]|uniref:GntP family permease n=1 Tax=Trichococcus alkaliphilus TaxID=2052943 RepID=UPI000D0ABC2C|nr:GntP family permease [Trichococcus alkaliphilus]